MLIPMVAKGGLLGGDPALASLLGVLTLLAGVPLAMALLFALPRKGQRVVFAAMVVATSYIQKPFYQEVLFQDYRGTDRGFGVTVPDLIFFGFFLFLLLRGDRRRRIWWPYNSGMWLLVIVVSSLSVLASARPLLSLFTVHKFVRCFVLFWVVVNVVREREDVTAVVWAFIVTTLWQGAVVFLSKYVTQSVVYRSVGTFNHPNALAMYLNMILPVILAVLMAHGGTRRANALAAAALLAGAICVLFAKSRAAIALLPVALVGVAAASMLAKPTVRKAMLIAAGLAAVGVVVILAAPRLLRRFETAPTESHLTRVYLNRAALAMAGEGPLGVGINMYSWNLKHTDAYWLVYPDKINVPDPEAFRASDQGQSRLGTAHHVYLLFAAETGWIGMAVFLLFAVRFYWRTLVVFLRERDPFLKAVLLGLLAGFTTVYLQSLLEWVLRMTDALYLLFILFGLVVAIGNMQSRPAPHASADPRAAQTG